MIDVYRQRVVPYDRCPDCLHQLWLHDSIFLNKQKETYCHVQSSPGQRCICKRKDMTKELTPETIKEV